MSSSRWSRRRGSRRSSTTASCGGDRYQHSPLRCGGLQHCPLQVRYQRMLPQFPRLPPVPERPSLENRELSPVPVLRNLVN